MPQPVEPGLCAGCTHARRISNRRGSVFLICAAATDDPTLRQYPQLPVLDCHAFLQRETATAPLRPEPEGG